MTPSTILGAILAGGGSRRLGGGDKGLLPVGGVPMIARVAAAMDGSVAGVVIVANGDPDRFAGLGLEVVPDAGRPAPGEGDGPLAGLLAALQEGARRPGISHVATAPADTPFLPAGFVDMLADAAMDGGAAVATSGDGVHPVVALWPVDLADNVERALRGGTRRLGAFADTVKHLRVPFPPERIGDRLVDPFLNVNSPDDLAMARRIAGEPEAGPSPAAAGRLADDCFVPGASMMRHDDAVALILARVRPVVGTEELPLSAASGRVLAADVSAPRDVPLADTAAVDGYAFLAGDHDATGGFMPVAARIFAGGAGPDALPAFSAARIFTGAAMPPGTDTVAMQEDCETHEQDGADYVIIPAGLRPGANRRRAGEDVRAGTAVMAAGLRLRPQDVGALASLGLERVTVRRRLRVALASTGDEVVRPGSPIRPGQVYDSNHALVGALAAAAGAEVEDAGVLPDDPDAVRRRLADAAARSDLVVTSGGVSEGDADHVAAALDRIGRRHLWKIAVKPGRPLAFGQIGDCAFLGLPGNPVAAFAGFLLYGLPLVAGLAGARYAPPRRFPLPAAFSIEERRTGRREFLRGILVETPGGGLAVDRFSRDGSSLITGLRAADGFIEIAEDCARIEAGGTVSFIPFSGFGIGVL